MINRHVKTYRGARSPRSRQAFSAVGLKAHTHGDPHTPHPLLAGIPEAMRDVPVYDDLLQNLTPTDAASFAEHCEACLWGLERLTEQVAE